MRVRRIVPDYNNHSRSPGLSMGTISARTTTARYSVLWLEANELDVGTVDARVARQFLDHDCRRPGPYG